MFLLNAMSERQHELHITELLSQKIVGALRIIGTFFQRDPLSYGVQPVFELEVVDQAMKL